MNDPLESVIEKARRDAFPPLSVIPTINESEEKKIHQISIPAEKNTQSSTNTFTGNKNTFDSITNPQVESSRHSWMSFPPRSVVDTLADNDVDSNPPRIRQYYVRIVNENRVPDDSWRVRVGGFVVGNFMGDANEDISLLIPFGLVVNGVPFPLTFEFIEAHGFGSAFVVSFLDESRTAVLINHNTRGNRTSFGSNGGDCIITIPI